MQVISLVCACQISHYIIRTTANPHSPMARDKTPVLLDALLGSSFCTVAVAVVALRVQLAVPQA